MIVNCVFQFLIFEIWPCPIFHSTVGMMIVPHPHLLCATITGSIDFRTTVYVLNPAYESNVSVQTREKCPKKQKTQMSRFTRIKPVIHKDSVLTHSWLYIPNDGRLLIVDIPRFPGAKIDPLIKTTFVTFFLYWHSQFTISAVTFQTLHSPNKYPNSPKKHYNSPYLANYIGTFL